jgi:hypothetical protein
VRASRLLEDHTMTHDDTPFAERISPEYVAYDLMRDIMFDDPKRPEPKSVEFRRYVLELYTECLATVKGERRSARPVATPPEVSPAQAKAAATAESVEKLKRRRVAA